ncbi:MAG TPA: hypothetical protein VL832_09040, partial [Puia sp.]|nr:hypothetical protein [Puia sp.]
YFPEFNRILLKVLPMYNKFRAPSVILVIPVFLLNLLAMLSLQRLWSGGQMGKGAGEREAPTGGGSEQETFWMKYKKGVYLIAGVFAVLLYLYVSFDYTTAGERQLQQQINAAGGEVATYGQSFLKGLREDRQALFLHSLERSLFFIAVVVVLAGFYIKGKVHSWIFLGLTGLLAFIDIMGIDVQYLNSDNYKDAAEAPVIPTPSAADKQVLQDTGTYRVLDLRPGLGTALTYGAGSAWWHHSVGGYNPAKLSIYQDLIDHQLGNYPQCKPVIDMLNTKYILQRGEGGGDTVLVNEGALGAAWFVRGVRFEQDARAVMNALTGFDPKDTAIVPDKDRREASVDAQPDSGGQIQLISHDNDEIVYRTDSRTRQFAVFSEVYYDRGWKVYLDGGDGADRGTELPIVRTNYVLRGVSVPAGRHTIRMVFHPASYYMGQRVQRIAGVMLVLLLLGGVVADINKKM